jgi:hypothetical protein
MRTIGAPISLTFDSDMKQNIWTNFFNEIWHHICILSLSTHSSSVYSRIKYCTSKEGISASLRISRVYPGRTLSRAVCRQLITAHVRSLSWVSSYGICGAQSGAWTGFFFTPVSIIPSILYRVIKKSLYTWRLYCNHQVHRDFLITLYFLPYILHRRQSFFAIAISEFVEICNFSLTKLQKFRIKFYSYQIFWVVVGLERGPLSLVRSVEELLE